ncbi:MAG: flagellar basal body rod protein FlgB [Nitrospirae bacterium]|nr:flagellar basal body rod protein FlgB [Nitrospirota bacterium]MBI3594075.1 flagellar basal body rod protein FlgB [Nitrospirota bacterium]
MEIFNKTIGILEKSLDIRSEKNRVISANIANQETPGFRANDVNFKEILKSATSDSSSIQLSRTSGSHLGGLSSGSTAILPTEIPGPSKRLDGNTVDSEMEMAKLAENQVNYSAAVQMISEKFKMLHYVISESK